VQFQLAPAGLTFPAQPITVPEHAAFIWPFGLDLGGVTLAYATAQPLTSLDESTTRTVFFAETPGIPAEFAFAEPSVSVTAPRGRPTHVDGRLVVHDLAPSPDVAIKVRTTDSREIHIVLLSDANSLALWKGPWRGRERLFLSANPLVFDGGKVRLTATSRKPESISVFPADEVLGGDQSFTASFAPLALTIPISHTLPLALEPRRIAGPLRTIVSGKAPKPVAAAPLDADFAAAAVWRIVLPANLDLSADPLLQFTYTGDVARVMIGDTFIMDDYANGEPLEVGLARYAELLKTGELTIAILPQQRDAPIFRPATAHPSPDAGDAEAGLEGAEIITRPTIEF
jgi:hypothetical protein